MGMQIDDRALIELRRDLHAHPEMGWTEFYTTARLAIELDQLGYSLYFGTEAVNEEMRLGVPDDPELEQALERARRDGAPEKYLAKMGEIPGLVAEKKYGEGPTIAVRVDIDALEIPEASDEDHVPASEQFASRHPGLMHACGHDGHATIGVGIARALDANDVFDGTLRIFFQPAEEGCRGGLAMSHTSHLEGVDALFSFHLGLGNDTGAIVAGYEKPLANAKLELQFSGEGSHAGREPAKGRNALLAAATAIQNLYGISRHASGATRVNVGQVHSSNPVNVISSETCMQVEVRAATVDGVEYLLGRAREIISNSARMHGVAVDTELYGRATTFTADQLPVNAVAQAARSHDTVTDVIERAEFGASEDVSHFVRRVQELGGVATYIGIGATHPAGHHTSNFDFDESSLGVGVDVVSDAILKSSRDVVSLQK